MELCSIDETVPLGDSRLLEEIGFSPVQEDPES
jgi:hypothetical protein